MPSHLTSDPIGSNSLTPAAASFMTRAGLLDQRDRDLEHPLERVGADPLGRLVVVLGAVRRGSAREPGGPERVGVRAAAGEDVLRLVAAGAQRALGERHLGGARADPVALEHPLQRDVEVALAGVGGVLQVVDHLGRERLGARPVEAAHLALDPAALGDDVDAAAALDRADVGGRLGVDAPELHRRDRARRGGDRAATGLGAHAGVGGAAVELGDDPVVGRATRRTISPIGVAWSNT